MSQSWILLLIAGALEVVWATTLKHTAGFTNLIPSLITAVSLLVSMAFLGLAVRELPIGTAYAVWTGIGAAGTAIYGMVISGESTSIYRIACILFIIIGTIGLKFLG